MAPFAPSDDRRMSVLALGTVQFGLQYGVANRGGKVAAQEVRATLEFARRAGLDMLDTAVAYGESEALLGQIGVRDWQVISKLPAVPDGCGDVERWVRDSVADSLARLNVARLYGLLLHRPGQLLDSIGGQLYAALRRLTVDGVVGKIGVSIYDPGELDRLCEHFAFDLVQAPFNILDRRLVETGWLSRLRREGTELHVRSVFLQGLLLMCPTVRPPKFARWSALWTALDHWQREVQMTPLQACLRYAASFPEIQRIIVGVDNVLQLQEIVAALDGPMPALPATVRCDELDLLDPSRWNSL